MFETVELGQKVSKEDFEAEVPELRAALLETQLELAAVKPFAVVVIISGVKGAGKRELVGTLNSWMDPRFIETHGFRPPSDEERERPHMWRFWRLLPPKGRIGLFQGSWYTWPIVERAFKRMKKAKLERDMRQIREFETMLVNEGVLVLKYWMHLSKQVQEKRLKSLAKDPATRWRVTRQDWDNFERYEAFSTTSERAIQLTSTAEAPWTLVEATDIHHQLLHVGRHMLAALKARAELAGAQAPRLHVPPFRQEAEAVNVLRKLDLSGRLDKSDYNKELERCQGRLALLTRGKAFSERSVVMVFEGMDAAGKGSTIRRVLGCLDPGRVSVIPVAAPTEEERAQPYLWRFWRHLPRAGSVAVFDRSWHGRVLVERVEGFCSEADWQRAYGEINEFEEQLHRSGTILLKFFLYVSQEEQLRRFQERADTPFKRFKITDEDWRNREKWPLYEPAVCDMLERTSTGAAPWHLIASEDKAFGRIQVLRAIVDRLERELG